METVDAKGTGQQLKTRFMQYVKNKQKKLFLPYNKIGGNWSYTAGSCDILGKEAVLNIIADARALPVANVPAKAIKSPNLIGDNEEEAAMYTARHYYQDSAASAEFAAMYVTSYQSYPASGATNMCTKLVHEQELIKLRIKVAELEADQKQLYLDIETLQHQSEATLTKKDEEIRRLKDLVEQQSAADAIVEAVKQKDTLCKQVAQQQKVLQEMEKQFVNMHIWSQSLGEEYHHVRSESNERIAELEQLIDFEGERLNEVSAHNQQLKAEKDRLGNELVKALRLGEQFMKRADSLQELVNYQQSKIATLQQRVQSSYSGQEKDHTMKVLATRALQMGSPVVMGTPYSAPPSPIIHHLHSTMLINQVMATREGTCFNVKTLLNTLSTPFKASRKFFRLGPQSN